MRFVVAFGLSGLALAVLAVRLAGEARGAWWAVVAVEGTLALSLLALAAVYGLRARGVAVEDVLARASWGPVVRLALMPYAALGATTLFVARWFDREGLLNLAAPGIYVGRLPFPAERRRVREAGVGAVLNLCWEFPRLSGIEGTGGIEVARVPILDGTPPTDRQFREAVAATERWRAEGRTVLIHCAQGHGRTATVAAAVLIRLGLAKGVDEALGMVRAARPLAVPSGEQREALVRFVAEGPPR